MPIVFACASRQYRSVTNSMVTRRTAEVSAKPLGGDAVALLLMLACFPLPLSFRFSLPAFPLLLLLLPVLSWAGLHCHFLLQTDLELERKPAFKSMVDSS